MPSIIISCLHIAAGIHSHHMLLINTHNHTWLMAFSTLMQINVCLLHNHAQLLAFSTSMCHQWWLLYNCIQWLAFSASTQTSHHLAHHLHYFLNIWAFSHNFLGLHFFLHMSTSLEHRSESTQISTIFLSQWVFYHNNIVLLHPVIHHCCWSLQFMIFHTAFHCCSLHEWIIASCCIPLLFFV